jgi:hypothetical protein
MVAHTPIPIEATDIVRGVSRIAVIFNKIKVKNQ